MPSERSELEGRGEPEGEADYAVYYLAVNDVSDKSFDNSVAWYRKILCEVLRDLPKTASILDVGCGAGLLVHALRTMGFTNVSGVDASQSMVAIAQARGLPVTHVTSDFFESLPVEAKRSYDLILLLDVLEHVPVARQLSFLLGIHRLLREQGQLAVSVPNATSVLAARWRYNDWTHTSAFTEHSLRFVLINAGFGDVRFLTHEFFGRPRMPFLPRRGVFYWWLHCLARGLWRLQVVAELGSQGWKVPLSLNLLAVAAVAGNRATANKGIVVSP